MHTLPTVVVVVLAVVKLKIIKVIIINICVVAGCSRLNVFSENQQETNIHTHTHRQTLFLFILFSLDSFVLFFSCSFSVCGPLKIYCK